MPVNLITNFEVRVAGGPTFASSHTQSVEAYDVLDVIVPDASTDVAVEVQPGSAGATSFLHVGASSFAPGLSYKIDLPGNPPNDLDRPLLLAGTGAVGLLGTAPGRLLFSNSTGHDVTVRILVGRDATP